MTLLAAAITQQITDLVNEPGAVGRLFASVNDTTKSYTWDPASFLYPLRHRVNCRAVYNSWLGRRDGPTLLDVGGDRRFAAHCVHFKPSSRIGSKAWFLDEDGSTVYERTVVDERIVEWSEGVPSDLRILMFNSPLPSTVYAAKVLPPHEQAVRKVGSWDRVPCFTVAATNSNLALRGIVRELSDVPGWHTYQTSPDYLFSDFSSPVGASGSPLFLLIDDQLVLLWCWGGAIVGDQLQRFRDNAEAALSDMAGSARVLVEVDLSGYDNAPPVLVLSPPVSSVSLGGSKSLFYWASYADELTITPDVGSVEPLTGHANVSPEDDTNYTLTAIVDGQSVATAQVTVNVLALPPAITLTTNDNHILVGQSATLQWSVSGEGIETIQLFCNGTLIGPVSADDSLVVSPQATTHYRVEATGSGGFNARTVQVLVSENEGETLVTTSYYHGTDSGNEGKIGHIPNFSTAATGDLIPPASLPDVGDTVLAHEEAFQDIAEGTSNANWDVTDQASVTMTGGNFTASLKLDDAFSLTDVQVAELFIAGTGSITSSTIDDLTIEEGTTIEIVSGTVGDIDFLFGGSELTIQAGTFNGEFTGTHQLVIHGGEFNTPMTTATSMTVDGSPVFNGPVTLNGGSISGSPTFNGPFILAGGTLSGTPTLNNTIQNLGGTIDAEFGPMYSPNSVGDVTITIE